MTLEIDIAHHFDGFDLQIKLMSEGGVLAFFGPSGAGKTSVTRAISGLLRPDRGKMTLQGEVLFDSDADLFLPPHKRRIGVVFQEARLFPHLNVAKNISFAATKSNSVNPSEIIDLCDLNRLLDRRVANLSGGEAQRVALARALMCDPRLLILDEPLSALDLSRRAQILPYLERLRDEKQFPMIYVSHSLNEVARLASEIAVMSDGKLIAHGSASEVLADPDVVLGVEGEEGGAVLAARFVRHHQEDGLSELALEDAENCHVFVPGVSSSIGPTTRLLISASDIILAREKPEQISALNILPVEVVSISDIANGGVAVRLALGQARLWARLTRKSARELELVPGQKCFAVIKSMRLSPLLKSQ